MTTFFVVVLMLAISLSALLLVVLFTHIRNMDKREKKNANHFTAPLSHKRNGPISTPYAERMHPV